jgi:hypothetical protein
MKKLDGLIVLQNSRVKNGNVQWKMDPQFSNSKVGMVMVQFGHVLNTAIRILSVTDTFQSHLSVIIIRIVG